MRNGELKIDAADIFDWDRLCEMAAYMELREVRTFMDAVRMFAYTFTSTHRVDDQNTLLADWIRNATHLQSRETAEEVLAALAEQAHGDLELLREFAKQNGVRLKRNS